MAQAAATSHDTAPEPGGAPLTDTADIIVDAIEQLSYARSVEDIAAVVRTSARKVSGADGVAIVVRDEDRCHYVDEDSIGPLWKGLKFPLTACISGWSMLNKQTAVIRDIYLDDRIPHDAYRPTYVKSLVMTPVGRDDPVAAIGAYWATERDPTDAEINALKALARATGTAFENVRLVSSLTESLERRDFLIRELDHRVKNMLASVQAIARQTLKTAPTQQAFVESFNGRLMALSRSHVLLTKENWKKAALGDVVTDAMAPFKEIAGRISVSGPPMALGPVQAVATHLALHELITNAIAHGALSVPEGDVALRWNVDMGANQRRLILTWSERGGPAAKLPAAKGMGMRLIEQGLPHALDGVGKVDFTAEGFRMEIVAPLSSTVQLA
jgi:two-component sensor histidine kinase